MDNVFCDIPFMVWYDLDQLSWDGRIYWWLELGSAPGDMRKAFDMAKFVINKDKIND
jgi:hypothetical protein